METSQRGIELVKRYEGLVTHSYLCPKGILTVGVGHTGSDVTKGMIITEEEAENLLKKDLKKIEDKLNYSLQHDNITLNQNQFDACISFIFNLGYSTLVFSTLWKNLKQVTTQEHPQNFQNVFILPKLTLIQGSVLR